jgi:hypothetical protein
MPKIDIEEELRWFASIARHPWISLARAFMRIPFSLIAGS